MRSFPFPRFPLALPFVAAVLLLAGQAFAHGGFWRAHTIRFDPADPEFIALRSDVWGLVISRDGGESWQWICSEAYGLSSINGRRVATVIAPEHRILIASLGDGLMMSEDACTWTAAEGFDGHIVRDVLPAPDDASHFYALSTRTEGDGMSTTHVWQSMDGGVSWTMFGMPLEGFTGYSLRVAPSMPARLYVAGRSPDTLRIARSDDAGANWTLFGHTVVVNADLWEPSISGVDPADPDQLYVWIDAFQAGGEQRAPDHYLFSADAGESWAQLVNSDNDLPGFAFSPDGSEVLIGGIDAGILAAERDAVAAQPAEAFAPVFDGEIYGLNWTERGLYAGNDDFAAEEKFSLGVSTERGRSFEPVMEICEITMLQCPESTFVGRACPLRFDDEEGGFLQDFLDPAAGRCGGGDTGDPEDDAGVENDAGPSGPGGGSPDAAMPQMPDATPTSPTAPDAGAPPADADDDEGCACGVVGRGSAGPPGLAPWLALGAALVLAGRRAGRRRAGRKG